MKKLKNFGIGSQVHYIPINNQPYYRKLGYKPLRNATKYYTETLSLPLHTLLSKRDIDFISSKLISILSKSSKTKKVK